MGFDSFDIDVNLSDEDGDDDSDSNDDKQDSSITYELIETRFRDKSLNSTYDVDIENNQVTGDIRDIAGIFALMFLEHPDADPSKMQE
jgi:hypothetical protein